MVNKLNKKIKDKIKKFNEKSDLLKGSLILNLKYSIVLKHLNACLQNYRKNQPKEYNYATLVRWYKENGSIKHEIVGYIKNKELINDFVEYVYNSNFIKEHNEKKTINDFIKRELVDYFYERNISKEAIIKNIITKFEKIHTWDFLFPLNNIKLSIPVFKLGSCKLINFNEYQKNRWKKNIKAHFKNSGNLQFALKDFDVSHKRFLTDKVCAKIEVITGDSKTASNKAKEKFQLFLNSIKYISTSWYPTFNKYKIFSQGELYKDWSVVIGISKTGGLGGHYSNENPSPFEFTKSNTKQMLSNGASNLNELLSLDLNNTNEFQRMIFHGINLFGEACSDANESSGYVKMTTLLEYLLIRNESISSNLSERIAFLFSSNPDMRKFYYGKIKNLYKTRCSIVHSANLLTDDKEFKQIRKVAFNVLLIMINIHDKIKTKNEFIEIIEKIKFGEKIILTNKKLILGL